MSLPIDPTPYVIPFTDWIIDASHGCNDANPFTYSMIVQQQGQTALTNDLNHVLTQHPNPKEISIFTNDLSLASNVYTVSVLAKLPSSRCSVK